VASQLEFSSIDLDRGMKTNMHAVGLEDCMAVFAESPYRRTEASPRSRFIHVRPQAGGKLGSRDGPFTEREESNHPLGSGGYVNLPACAEQLEALQQVDARYGVIE
jgi:hypothetical protein